MADRFVYNKAGFDAVRNSGAVMAACLSHAQATTAAANAQTSSHYIHGRKVKGTFTCDVRAGASRCTAMVKPTHDDAGNIAAGDCARDNILLRSVR